MPPKIPKIDEMVHHGAFAYWRDAKMAPTPLAQECREDLVLSRVAGLMRDAEALIDRANDKLQRNGYMHRFHLDTHILAPPPEWPDASLTVREALSFLRQLPADAMMSHTFKAPWSPDADYSGDTDPGCEGVHFELLPGPVPAAEFAARLRCAVLTDHAEIARVLGFSDPEGIGGCPESAHVYTQTPSQSSRRDYDNHPLTFAALDALVIR